MQIKQLEWHDPTVHPHGCAAGLHNYGGKTWIAETPWDRDYSIDSFDKPEGTLFMVSFSWEGIDGDPITLEDAKALAQADHEARIKGMITND